MRKKPVSAAIAAVREGESAGAPVPSHLWAALAAAFPVTLPVLAGYLFLGTAYGILMDKLGFGPGWTALVSIMVLGGSIQMIGTSLYAAGFHPLNALIISAVVNARHLFYGFSMLEPYSGTGWKKPFLVFWLTDETFSLLCSGDTPKGVDPQWFRFFVSGLGYCYWIGGSLVGNVGGSLLAFDARGIEFVMTSLFAAIVLNQWRASRNHSPAIIGFAVSVVCLLLFGPGYFIIPSMAAIAAALLLFRKRIEDAAPVAEEEDCR